MNKRHAAALGAGALMYLADNRLGIADRIAANFGWHSPITNTDGSPTGAHESSYSGFISGVLIGLTAYVGYRLAK